MCIRCINKTAEAEDRTKWGGGDVAFRRVGLFLLIFNIWVQTRVAGWSRTLFIFSLGNCVSKIHFQSSYVGSSYTCRCLSSRARVAARTMHSATNIYATTWSYVHGFTIRTDELPSIYCLCAFSWTDKEYRHYVTTCSVVANFSQFERILDLEIGEWVVYLPEGFFHLQILYL